MCFYDEPLIILITLAILPLTLCSSSSSHFALTLSRPLSGVFGFINSTITENAGLCGDWTYRNATEAAVANAAVGWSYSAPVLPDGYIAIGHALWHVFAAYGLHCLVCVVIFIRAPLHGTHCYFLRSKNPCANLWLLVFPIVKYARDPLAAESWKLAPAAAPNVEV